MSAISVARLVSESVLYEEDVPKFVKCFGHYMDLTPENWSIFASKVSSWDAVMEYFGDQDILYNMGEQELRDLATTLGIEFCGRQDDIWDRTYRMSNQQKAEFFTPLIIRQLDRIGSNIPDMTTGGGGRPMAIEEVELIEMFSIHYFARLFGNACTLNVENFGKYYRKHLSYGGKSALARRILDEIPDDKELWEDLANHLKVDAKFYRPDNWENAEKSRQIMNAALTKLSQNRLMAAAVEVITKKLDKAMRKQMAKEVKKINKAIGK
jgi:hypothetical protein